MEKFKGTPGPWEFYNDNGEEIVIQSGSLESGNGWVGFTTIAAELQCHQDATLIAAAPDLLEQLQWVVAELKDWIDSELEGTCAHQRALSVLDKPNAAIARALGKNDGDK